MSVAERVLGRRLANREQDTQKLGWFEAVPAMGLDALGSASYGPEAALSVMIPLGAAGLSQLGWVMAPIIGLLAILYLSYRQTIVAYPVNGGAYTVARANLGVWPGLLAAAALMIDYVLNVAVGIAAGVGALISSVPALQPFTLTLCLSFLLLITLANLRGTAEAGWLFSLPTYLFLFSFLGVIGAGLWQVAAGAAPPTTPRPATGLSLVSLWLLMRAFAAGCTAMTGVEAVSNGVGAFKPPAIAQARRTLTILCGSLGLLLAGITFLAPRYHLLAMDQTKPGYRSILSQLVDAVAGQGTLYYIAMASVLAVLCLSANTSFVAFPRLCRMIAQDGYLPRSFAVAGRRLVFSVGIGFLTLVAGGLLILFGGITDRLIPLFAVGAFLTFTLSQLGMVAHWRKLGRNRRGLAINALGALTTAIALTVIAAAKFAEGAWIVVLAIPLVLLLFSQIHGYYGRLDRSLAATRGFDLADYKPTIVVVPIETRTRLSDEAIAFAMTLSPQVIAVHLQSLEGPEAEENGRQIKAGWEKEVEQPLREKGLHPPRLILLPAATRQIHTPLLRLMEKLDLETPGSLVAILIPELVLSRWWERLLHARRGERLKNALLRDGGPRLRIIMVPWRSDC